MDQAGNEVYDFIFKLDRRVGYLEKDLSFIEKKISALDVYKTKMYDTLRGELGVAKIMIEDIRGKLKNISIGINALSSDMKDVIKVEQGEALKKQVDELPLHEYIAKREMKNIIIK